MADEGEVVWAPDPFKSTGGNPRPWLVVAADSLPYSDEESIAVAFTTQSHHSGSLRVPSNAWVRGEPGTQSFVLPWTLATLKDDIHIAGVQGTITEAFRDRVTAATLSYFDHEAASG